MLRLLLAVVFLGACQMAPTPAPATTSSTSVATLVQLTGNHVDAATIVASDHVGLSPIGGSPQEVVPWVAPSDGTFVGFSAQSHRGPPSNVTLTAVRAPSWKAGTPVWTSTTAVLGFLTDEKATHVVTALPLGRGDAIWWQLDVSGPLSTWQTEGLVVTGVFRVAP